MNHTQLGLYSESPVLTDEDIKLLIVLFPCGRQWVDHIAHFYLSFQRIPKLQHGNHQRRGRSACWWRADCHGDIKM